MRLLILIGVGYLLYRWVAGSSKKRFSARLHRPPDRVDDIMAQDPWCETYIPRHDGVHLRLKGRDYFFCSEKCRDSFIALHEKRT